MLVTISIINNILEKHVKSLCQEHLCEQAPISPRQWGFMSSRSSFSALLQVIEDWSIALDQGQEVCVVFFMSIYSPHKLMVRYG